MREKFLKGIKGKTFDVLIIGGGITGAGILRDAALRGMDAILVEKGDFSEGTSSRSSKLIHGGLRYLEQFNFKLVFESLQERGILRKLFPHLVKPVKFLYPVYKKDKHGLFTINLGLTLYDILAVTKNYKLHSLCSKRKVKEIEPELNENGLKGGVLYYDFRASDSRLVIETIKSAIESGGFALNYFEFLKPIYEDGEIKGAVCRDRITGIEYTIKSRTVVNATGPFTDITLTKFPFEHRKLLKTSKGIHIVFEKSKFPLNNVVVMNAVKDGRVTFAIPWGSVVYVGTTDTECSEDELENPKVTDSDITYLIETVKHYFPRVNLKKQDIISSWAGIRPLINEDKENTYSISREHIIVSHPGGAFTITGGKLTTYRKMAEQMIDRVISYLREKGLKKAFLPCATKRIKPMASKGAEDFVFLRKNISNKYGIPHDVAGYLVSSYGAYADRVLEYSKQDKELLQKIDENEPFVFAEIPYAIEHEMAMKLSDIIVRRTEMFYKIKNFDVEKVKKIIEKMKNYLPLDDEKIAGEISWFRDYSKNYRGFA